VIGARAKIRTRFRVRYRLTPINSHQEQIVVTFREERGVTITPLAGIALGAVAFIVAGVRGPSIPPEGDLMKPATFDVAVGVFILSLVPWLNVSGFSETARRRWRTWMVGLLIYAFGIETIQQFRGIDPRFSKVEPGGQISG
jgi:hypothetical protein